MKCPVCDKENLSMLCPQCSFDSSRDYGRYPTFGAVGRVPSVSALQEQWQEKQKPQKTGKRVAQEKITRPVDPPNSAPTASPVPKNKWIAFFLCLYLGIFGAHKFYEGKKSMGFLYLCTFGLFGYGWLIDCITLLFKPNPYFPQSGQSHRKN